MHEKLAKYASQPALNCPADVVLSFKLYFGTTGNSGVPIPQQERSFLNHFMPSAAKSAHGCTAPADTKPPRGKYPEKKIDGMDYYEFCELIRSNSL